MDPFGHAVPVSVAALLLLAAACNTYDSSLLEGVEPETSIGGGGSGSAASSSSGESPNDSSSTSDGGVGGTSFEATSSGGASAEVGGNGGNSDAVGGTGGADEATGSSTETNGGGNGGSGGSSGNAGGGGGSGGGNTGAGNSGGSGGCDAGDCCPENLDKLEPGQCGCEVPDTDTDADGIADCIDSCPADGAKSDPGECGCGWRDEDTSAGPGCVALKNGLAHRYAFTGEGAEASDSQGDATAQILGTTLDGSGSVVLGTAEGQYVELPSGMISAFPNVTLELWFAWDGGALWTRVLDFGSTVEGVPGEPGTGESFVLISPNGEPGPAYPYAGFNPPGDAIEVACSGIGALTTGETHHIALSLDTQGDTFTLYVDGMLACAKALPFELSEIDDANCWLGRSQFASDGGFVGTIEEFRIYDVALSASQVALSYQAGPDPPFLTDQTDE